MYHQRDEHNMFQQRGVFHRTVLVCVLNEKRFIAKPQLVCLYHPSWMINIPHTILGEWFLFE
jgi:hypothetical protein